MVALALPGFLRAAPVLRAIVAALLARSAIHAAGKLKKFSAPALAVRRDEVHELMELLPGTFKVVTSLPEASCSPEERWWVMGKEEASGPQADAETGTK